MIIGQRDIQLTIPLSAGTSITRFKYLSFSVRMFFRECKGKNGGVVVLRWVFFLCAIGKADQRNVRLFKASYTSYHSACKNLRSADGATGSRISSKGDGSLWCFRRYWYPQVPGDLAQPDRQLAGAVKASNGADRLIKSLLGQFLRQVRVTALGQEEFIDCLGIIAA